ncbi:hypothetical protein RJ639_019373 [Escallonia herrerae]|uniref:TF-B3 domain-containing protein n=1 Tax=Escallonia herrerae TaxID=1293975 RepID=A0AA89AHZ4_9ASTE|nr:hypothetical protein RJ639_019373 [Escallonia herrerae]
MGSRPFGSLATAPHFFKIIDRDIVQDQRLRLPRKFVSEYGNTLSDTVFLDVPIGAKWEVGLVKSDGDVWLWDGWKEFVSRCSIGLWHFLVFRYEGNSIFHIIICDMSASEIEYPVGPGRRGQFQLGAEGTQVDEKMDKSVPKAKINLSCTLNGIQDAMLKPVKVEDDLIRSVAKGTLPNSKFPATERKQRASEAGKAIALDSVKAFKSHNPFFKVTMQPSYVSGKSPLNVPRSFFDKYLTEKLENVDILLQVSDGRTCRVKCCIFPLTAKFCSGWYGFARDNSLSVGGVCVFELVSGIKKVLKVVIFRAGKDATPCKKVALCLIRKLLRLPAFNDFATNCEIIMMLLLIAHMHAFDAKGDNNGFRQRERNT